MKPLFLNICLAIGLTQAATLPYQGLATDVKGNPKADASYPAGFALYSAPMGGSALWTESQSVATKKGLFSTTLGSVAIIPDSLFKGTALYLGVSFDGGSEGGRVLLGSTPWATRSGNADSARISHLADSAKVVVGLKDSTKVLRDSIGRLSENISNQAIAIAQLQALALPYDYDIPWNSKIIYGYLRDRRDGQMYRTVTIGAQVWMAQNLNFITDSSWSISNSIDSAAKYGRLYNWASALGLNDSCNRKSCGAITKAKMQGVCPIGWHVPSYSEWDTLRINAVYFSNLHSASEWGAQAGKDSLGFRVIGAGERNSNGVISYDYSANFWSTMEFDAMNSYCVEFQLGCGGGFNEYGKKSSGYSIRCLKN